MRAQGRLEDGCTTTPPKRTRDDREDPPDIQKGSTTIELNTAPEYGIEETRAKAENQDIRAYFTKGPIMRKTKLGRRNLMMSSIDDNNQNLDTFSARVQRPTERESVEEVINGPHLPESSKGN